MGGNLIERGGSNECPQSMFLTKNNKIMYTPVNPNFAIYKWGVMGPTFHGHVIMMLTVLVRKSKTKNISEKKM